MVLKFLSIFSEMKSSKTILYICTQVSYLVTLHPKPLNNRISPWLYTYLNDVDASRVGNVAIPITSQCEIVENTLQVIEEGIFAMEAQGCTILKGKWTPATDSLTFTNHKDKRVKTKLSKVLVSLCD